MTRRYCPSGTGLVFSFEPFECSRVPSHGIATNPVGVALFGRCSSAKADENTGWRRAPSDARTTVASRRCTCWSRWSATVGVSAAPVSRKTAPSVVTGTSPPAVARTRKRTPVRIGIACRSPLKPA